MTGGAPSAPETLILVVEDDRELQYLLSVVLADEAREIVVVGTGEEGRRVLEEREVSLLVLDLILPDIDGRTLLSELRARAATATLPVICVSTRSEAAVRAECYALGADSFVEKPFDPALLSSDVTLRLQRAREHERDPYRDGLTGLLNRAGFLDALSNLPPEARHSILMAELDGFHRLTERFGWSTAEGIVNEVAGVLRTAAADGATLARWGGAEFGVLFVDLALPEAAETAAALVDAVRKVPVKGPDGETFRVTISGGLVASFVDPTVEGRLDAAQACLFQARDGGGNRIVTPETSPERPAARGPVLVAEDDDITAKIIRHRLEKEGFRVARFSDGQEAYDGAMSETPSLVLLDVKMPAMDGFEVLERLRKTPAYARIPIVMLTSMGSEADIVRGFDLGADDYILKPFSPVELIARLRRLMARGEAAATD